MSKETAGSRLRAAREAAGFTSAAAAAKALGVGSSTYASHENAQNKFDPERAIMYGRKFKISPVYLLFGEEYAPANATGRRLVETFDPDVFEDAVDDGMHVGSETGARGIPHGTVPQIDVTAGMGGGGLTILHEGVVGKNGMTFSAEAVSDFWRLPVALLNSAGVNPEDLAILSVQGDSMSPTLHDGEFVVLDTRHRVPSPDGIYGLNDAFGGVVVKRLEVTSKPGAEQQAVRVLSDNPRHAAKEWLLEDLRIVGRVLWRFGVIQ